ncbi:type I restriction-modification system subunit M N-terminal domain-containing protein [Lysinibacillus sp. OTC-L20]|uniref:type I restriction-modification system subunit M N-terminal domain-containing protein n=1 Tax=Lysinibacillus sp. OTC-L20 TaxID=3342791 RepID=UPI0035BB0B91
MELQKENKASNEQLKWLWEATEKLRKEVDLTSYKEYILQLLFLRQISNQPNVVVDLDMKLFEPRKLHNSLEHHLAYYQFSNGGMSNDNK